MIIRLDKPTKNSNPEYWQYRYPLLVCTERQTPEGRNETISIHIGKLNFLSGNDEDWQIRDWKEDIKNVPFHPHPYNRQKRQAAGVPDTAEAFEARRYGDRWRVEVSLACREWVCAMMTLTEAMCLTKEDKGTVMVEGEDGMQKDVTNAETFSELLREMKGFKREEELWLVLRRKT